LIIPDEKPCRQSHTSSKFDDKARLREVNHPDPIRPKNPGRLRLKAAPRQATSSQGGAYFDIASSTATATATVAPTIGLLPMPINPIISTCAGTEEEPANWASECMRPMVSVIP